MQNYIFGAINCFSKLYPLLTKRALIPKSSFQQWYFLLYCGELCAVTENSKIGVKNSAMLVITMPKRPVKGAKCPWKVKTFNNYWTRLSRKNRDLSVTSRSIICQRLRCVWYLLNSRKNVTGLISDVSDERYNQFRLTYLVTKNSQQFLWRWNCGKKKNIKT